MVDPISFGPLRPAEHRKTAAASTRANVESKTPTLPAIGEQATSTVSLGKLTAMARELADSAAPVDYARIAQIRQAISRGTYPIDPKAIADAMLLYYDSVKP
jgi:flagellar biosynthesis anti-sigma factor FlgM